MSQHNLNNNNQDPATNENENHLIGNILAEDNSGNFHLIIWIDSDLEDNIQKPSGGGGTTTTNNQSIGGGGGLNNVYQT
jgi:hypothetical protein